MKKKRVLPVLLLSVFLFHGCFVYDPAASFVAQRYTNTVSYFNTFYNAERLFSEAESEYLRAEREYREQADQSRPFSVPAAARTKFTTSIEKNSKLLSFYPRSKWVPDALLMIGKAYYYIGDDVRAERKFLELAAQYPGSDEALEGTFWRGRSLLRMKKTDAAVELLLQLESKALPVDDDIAGRAAYELARSYFSSADYERALRYFRRALETTDDDDIAPEAQYQIGRCLELRGEFSDARYAYDDVQRYGPGYTLQFNAELSSALVVARMGQYDAALDRLNDMLDDMKNREFFGRLHLEVANILMQKGERAEAVQKYVYVDTAFARSDAAARSYFALARYFETTEVNYDSARNYYGRAKTEFPASAVTAEAAAKHEVFVKYFGLTRDLARYDSLILFTARQKAAGDSAAASYRDSLTSKDSAVVRPPAPKKAASPGRKGEMKPDTSAVDSTFIKREAARLAAHTVLTDSLRRSVLRTKFELGGLFFLEMPIPDSAVHWFSMVVATGPESELAPRALYSIAEIYRSILPRPQEVRDSLYRVIIERYPASPYAQEARKSLGLPLLQQERDPAEELYASAEVRAELGQVTEALSVLRDIERSHPLSPVRPKAMYMSGWLYEHRLTKSDSAVAVYRRLLAQYPATPYAAEARPKVAAVDAEAKRIDEERKAQELERQRLEEEEKAARTNAVKPVSAPADSAAAPPKEP